MTDIGHNNPPVMIAAEIEYRGYKIEVDEHYRFKVSGADWPERRFGNAFDTLSAAKAEIDENIKKLTKQEAVAKTLKLELRDRNGKTVVFRGFNSNTSDALLTPPKKDRSNWYRDDNDLYPDVPWLNELLAERAKHETRIAEIDKITRLYGVRARAESYGRIHSEHYQTVLDSWLTKINEKREETLKATPQKETT